MLPCIHGHSARDKIETLQQLARGDVPAIWSSRLLRICEECIADGFHLRVHQHLAVGSCPLHGLPMRSKCNACGVSLSYSSVDHGAFCCQTCGCCLLKHGEIRFGIQGDFRSQFARINEEVRQWLRLLSAGTRQDCLRHYPGGELDGELAQVDARSFLLTAVHHSSARSPSWLSPPYPMHSDISIATVCPEETSLMKSFRRAKQVEHWSLEQGGRRAEPGAAHPSNDGEVRDRTLTAHYRQAFIRITANFIRSVRAAHPQCLDTPYRVLGDQWDQEFMFKHELLGCCPVALGFWLWRERCAKHFTKMAYMRPDRYFHDAGITQVSGSLDLLFYALGRSDLHSCILVANKCAERWAETGDEISSMCMFELWRLGEAQMDPGKSTWLDFDPPQSGVTFVRVDATNAIKRIACLGAEPYYRSLRRRLNRRLPYLNTETKKIDYLNLEPNWKEYVNEQVDPFCPVGDDWVFLTDKQFPIRRGGGRYANFARMELTYAIDPFACVNSAINLRTSAPG